MALAYPPMHKTKFYVSTSNAVKNNVVNDIKNSDFTQYSILKGGTKGTNNRNLSP